MSGGSNNGTPVMDAVSSNHLRMPPSSHQRNSSTGAEVAVRQMGSHQRKTSGSNISRKSAPPGGWNDYDSDGSDESDDSSDDEQSFAGNSELLNTTEVDSSFVITSNAAPISSKRGKRRQKRQQQQKTRRKRQHEAWVLLVGLRSEDKDALPDMIIPRIHEGLVHKRRKWPMKGWHKRYFVLEEGFLKYAKSKSDMINRGRYQGKVDLGQCCISYKEKRRRIHIDCDQTSLDHHLKFKKSDAENFLLWLEQLKQHRLYRHLLLSRVGLSDSEEDTAVASVTEVVEINDSDNPPVVARQHSADGLLDGIVTRQQRLRSSNSYDGSSSPGPDTAPNSAGFCGNDKRILVGNQTETNKTQINDKHQVHGPANGGDGSEYSSRTRTLPRGSTLQRTGSVGSKSVGWLLDHSAADQVSRDLNKAQNMIFDLTRVLENFKLELQNQSSTAAVTSSKPPPMITVPTTVATTSSSSGRRGRHFNLRRKRHSNDQTQSSVVIQSKASTSSLPISRSPTLPLSSSNPNLQSTAQPNKDSSVQNQLNVKQGGLKETGPCEQANRHSAVDMSSMNTWNGGVEDERSLTEHPTQFIQTAASLLDILRLASRTISGERERLKCVLEGASSDKFNASAASEILRLKNQLVETVHQNSELKTRLMRIHADSDLTGVTLAAGSTLSRSPATDVKSLAKMSASLSRDSISEFFDANEYMSGDSDNDSSSEGSDDESEESDDGENSNDGDGGLSRIENSSIMEGPMITAHTGRRDCLPAPQQDTSNLSLWNLLCRNIGKDLSKIRMPVQLCEPLNSLQRICEELEYSDLLDTAATLEDPLERLVYVAAFAVSGYSSTFYRSSTKPFNPLQGETFECIRDDKGWKFVSEQVSHHPPISCAHCCGEHWSLWQDIRVKNKFWGKSIECVPVGLVHVKFPKFNEVYSWNKVTMCVHNLFGDKKWLDHYGEVQINSSLQDGECGRITFHKTKQEISGVVRVSSGRTKQLFGKWNEAFYSGQGATASLVWRPGAMPEDAHLYYGFTRFAVELNEPPSPVFAAQLPATDTRFRPDQRLLEEGRLPEAEAEKMRVEAMQRERSNPVKARWFKLTNDDQEKGVYEFTGDYWRVRSGESGGFKAQNLAALW